MLFKVGPVWVVRGGVKWPVTHLLIGEAKNEKDCEWFGRKNNLGKNPGQVMYLITFSSLGHCKHFWC